MLDRQRAEAFIAGAWAAYTALLQGAGSDAWLHVPILIYETDAPVEGFFLMGRPAYRRVQTRWGDRFAATGGALLWSSRPPDDLHLGTLPALGTLHTRLRVGYGEEAFGRAVRGLVQAYAIESGRVARRLPLWLKIQVLTSRLEHAEDQGLLPAFYALLERLEAESGRTGVYAQMSDDDVAYWRDVVEREAATHDAGSPPTENRGGGA